MPEPTAPQIVTLTEQPAALLREVVPMADLSAFLTSFMAEPWTGPPCAGGRNGEGRNGANPAPRELRLERGPGG